MINGTIIYFLRFSFSVPFFFSLSLSPGWGICWVISHPWISNLRPLGSRQNHMMSFIATITAAALLFTAIKSCLLPFHEMALWLYGRKISSNKNQWLDCSCVVQNRWAALSLLCAECSLGVIVKWNHHALTFTTQKPHSLHRFHKSINSILCLHLHAFNLLCVSVEHRPAWPTSTSLSGLYSVSTLAIMRGHKRRQEIIFFCCFFLERGTVLCMILKCHCRGASTVLIDFKNNSNRP